MQKLKIFINLRKNRWKNKNFKILFKNMSNLDNKNGRMIKISL